jgi:hypothetical protein
MVTGSCLCASVAFEIDGRLSPLQYCHAARCRKATGSAFAAERVANASDFLPRNLPPARSRSVS